MASGKRQIAGLTAKTLLVVPYSLHCFSLRFQLRVVFVFITFHRRRTSSRTRRESFWLGKWQNQASDLVGPGHIYCAVDLIQAKTMSIGIKQIAMQVEFSELFLSFYIQN